jgi:hypothetical protein
MSRVLTRSRRAGLVILALVVVGLGYAGWAEAQGVDGAIDAFIQAMHRKNPRACWRPFPGKLPGDM